LETGSGMKDVQLADDLAAAFAKDSWDAPIIFDRDNNHWVGIRFFIEDRIGQARFAESEGCDIPIFTQNQVRYGK
jgi:hypothetical protein